MRIEYDANADAAYIYVVSRGPGRSVAKSKFCNVEMEGSAVILSLDASNGLLGIEILGASKVLPRSLLVEDEPE